MNSKDLCLLEYVPDLMELGIDAFKVEGRMKSPLYVASAASVYRQAIDQYALNCHRYNQQQMNAWMYELSATASRPFTSGFLKGENIDLQDIHKTDVIREAEFCGVVKGYDPKSCRLEIEQRANFGLGDILEIFLPGGITRPFEMFEMYDQDDQQIERARHPKQRVFVPCTDLIPELSILRRVTRKHE